MTKTGNPDLDFKFRGRYQVTTIVTEQQLHDVLCSAVESSAGSRYWATIDVGKHKIGWANYFTAKFTTTDTETTYRLSVKKLVKGLNVLANKYPVIFANIINDTCDASTGDALVQCALLGRIIYG